MLKIELITVGPLETNCYIIYDMQQAASNTGVIIDPGDDAQLILQLIGELKIKQIPYILCTHGHFDHLGAVAELKKRFKNAKFLIHEADLFFVTDAEATARSWGIKIQQPPNPDAFIKHGITLTFDDKRIKVIHTPGHSPGSVSYIIEDKIFVGDTLFFRSTGRTDFRGGSFKQLVYSIRNRLYKLNDDIIVYPGHGPTTTIGAEKLFNPIVKID